MKGCNLLLVAPVVGLLSGCISCETTFSCPAPSEGYLQVRDLDDEAQIAAMQRMPLEQRLNVYHDVYVRSGHPRTMLTEGFEGTGAAGFDAVIARMTDRASFNEYFWIIYWMSLRGELDVCEPHRIGRLDEKAQRFHVGDRTHPVPIDFGRCEFSL